MDLTTFMHAHAPWIASVGLWGYAVYALSQGDLATAGHDFFLGLTGFGLKFSIEKVFNAVK